MSNLILLGFLASLAAGLATGVGALPLVGEGYSRRRISVDRKATPPVGAGIRRRSDAVHHFG